VCSCEPRTEPERRIDLVRAWVWYNLAAKGGDAHATEKLTQLQAQLCLEQRAEAQRLLAVWQPGQCAEELEKT
jgi:hypothetical protein